MAPHERIKIDPEIMDGRPVIRGTRLTVEFMLGLMADGWSMDEILDDYPGVTREDLLACLEPHQEPLQERIVRLDREGRAARIVPLAAGR